MEKSHSSPIHSDRRTCFASVSEDKDDIQTQPQSAHMTQQTRKSLAKSATISRNRAARVAALYRQPLTSVRTGPLFSAFPYPTKISPETIALFIASHTKPGDTVFDGFAGSGTTGVAALLCGAPTPEMCAEAKRLELKVQWGARRAVLYDIGVLSSTIAETLGVGA